MLTVSITQITNKLKKYNKYKIKYNLYKIYKYLNYYINKYLFKNNELNMKSFFQRS
jgi:hypothetical protein